MGIKSKYMYIWTCAMLEITGFFFFYISCHNCFILNAWMLKKMLVYEFCLCVRPKLFHCFHNNPWVRRVSIHRFKNNSSWHTRRLQLSFQNYWIDHVKIINIQRMLQYVRLVPTSFSQSYMNDLIVSKYSCLVRIVLPWESILRKQGGRFMSMNPAERWHENLMRVWPERDSYATSSVGFKWDFMDTSVRCQRDPPVPRFWFHGGTWG